MKYVYIGSFPPPYGGVTIKNNILYNSLINSLDCEKINLSKVKNFEVLHVLRFLKTCLNNDSVFIIGAAGIWRRRFSKLLYFINRKALNKSILVVMGGKSAGIIAKDKQYLKYVSIYKKIYVETYGMKKDLEVKGLNNVDIFPNCRNMPNNDLKLKDTYSVKFKLVYFSQISEEKGADIVCEAAKLLNLKKIEYNIDFYGNVNKKFKETFFTYIDMLPNVNYCGVFKPDKDDVYVKLAQYDVLLFPSRWKYEGVPGILVESKIAGITAIVSDINYNSEIISNNINGIVLKRNTASELASIIEYLCRNRDKLNVLKTNAKLSSEYYLIENYINNIINEIKEIKT
ncbi:Glycosyltransferase Gtf1 [bioreactor metagenome]|uniref:Glycosyltransferase Gtf1 n=1 Tax=bioreactor metagenome TaxID=1076179 RepID=A0A644XBS9_9ZZZZ|nr:glycosyltransferase [Candidatus Metalachnospira sp.]